MKKRNISLDLFRIAATIAVITIHVTGLHWMQQEVGSFSWYVYNFFRAIVRWAVPAFIMISGSLFLNPAKAFDLKILYKKNILRIVTAFIFWSFIYAIYESDGTILALLKHFIRGSGHMWFIFLILILYVLLPVMRWIVADQRREKVFLIGSFVLGFCIPTILDFVPTFFQLQILTGIPLILMKIVQKGFGWTFYYCFGWYLARTPTCGRVKSSVTFFGLFSFVSSFFLFAWYARNLNYAPNEIYDNISLTVLCETSMIFLFFKDIQKEYSETVETRIFLISKLTFGVYMVHMLVLWRLDKIFSMYSSAPVFVIPLLVILTFLISLVIVMGLHKIPKLRKYII